MIDAQTLARYRYWRRTLAEMYPWMGTGKTDEDGRGSGQGLAQTAISYVRAEKSYRDTLDRFSEWTHASGWDRLPYGAFASADMNTETIDLQGAPDGYTIKVLIGDDPDADLGDVELSEDERAAYKSFYVAVIVIDDTDDSEIYHDGIGGVDVIDLDGFLQRDWEDAAAYALVEYLLDGALSFATERARIDAFEPAERAYWESRDVCTVSS